MNNMAPKTNTVSPVLVFGKDDDQQGPSTYLPHRVVVGKKDKESEVLVCKVLGPQRLKHVALVSWLVLVPII
jgi:hypothetical protein